MLGVLPGVVGTIQATEAVKLIIGQGDPLIGRLLLFDALKMKFKELKLRKDPKCPLCGPAPTVTELIDYEFFCGTAPAQKTATFIEEIDVEEVKEAIDAGRIPAEIDLLDIREPFEAKIAQIPQSKLISLAEFPQKMHELDSAREIWLYCKDGARAAARPGNCCTTPAFERSRMSPAESMHGARILTQASRGIDILPAMMIQRGPVMSQTEASPDVDVEDKLKEAFARGWSVIVWNDPINLMDYVVYVFKSVLKMNEQDASRHMWEVHQAARAWSRARRGRNRR